MILLDTHIWIWYVDDKARLSTRARVLVEREEPRGLGVSAFSMWEVAKSVSLGRLSLTLPVVDWLEMASGYPGVVILPITPAIADDSVNLPGSFHKDPADQIIVATARTYNIGLLTVDTKILAYDHVRLALEP